MFAAAALTVFAGVLVGLLLCFGGYAAWCRWSDRNHMRPLPPLPPDWKPKDKT